MLQCSVVTVRGITSGVEIFWTAVNDNTQLRRAEVKPTIINSTAVYTDYFVINEKNDGNTEYECTVMINTYPQVIATDTLVIINGMQYIYVHMYSYIHT